MVDSKGFIARFKKIKSEYDYEYEGLNMALDYAMSKPTKHKNIAFFTDSMEVIWFIREEKLSKSRVQNICLEKLSCLRLNKSVTFVWVKRNENLAGIALEYYTRRKFKGDELKIKIFSCKYCNKKFLEKDFLGSHIRNEHAVYR